MRHGACRVAKNNNAALAVGPARRRGGRSGRSAPGRHLQFRPDVNRNLDAIIVDEMADLEGRDAPELGPRAERADRRFFVFREDPALAQAEGLGLLSALAEAEGLGLL